MGGLGGDANVDEDDDAADGGDTGGAGGGVVGCVDNKLGEVDEVSDGGKGCCIGEDGSAGDRGVLERGESCKLISPSQSLNNSTSQRRLAAFLVRFAGGDDAVSGESVGVVGGGVAGGKDASKGGGGDVCVEAETVAVGSRQQRR